MHHITHEAVLQVLREGKKIERQKAFSSLLSLENALREGFALSLKSAECWDDCVLRPLRAHELRVQLPGLEGYFVLNATTNQCIAELPPKRREPMKCVHWIDQGSVGASAMSFLTHFLQYFVLVLPDPNHRVWKHPPFFMHCVDNVDC
jgi:hypothetical protein